MAKRRSPGWDLSEVLRRSGPRPASDAHQSEKGAYATRFANHMAMLIADGLRPHFRGILPDESGRGLESPARSVRGPKKLDVNYSTPQLGLALGISLKSVHIREPKGTRGYTHNMKRNDEELRVEASGYHARQPYAVMIGVLFLPDDACDDGNEGQPSSFGKWVQYLRPLSGRKDPGDDIMLYEKVFISLYDPNGTRMEFFDVETAPPKLGRPQSMLSYSAFLQEVKRAYDRRNHTEFTWWEEGNHGDPT